MKDSTASTVNETIVDLHADPVKFCRLILPHWFPKPMPWFHRGILAIRLRRADFLLKFGEEIWGEEEEGITKRWTKKDLAKLVRCFKAPIDPSDPKSELENIFKLNFGPDGRTPIGIQMKLGQHVSLILPRGYSKTTLMNAAEMFDIAYSNAEFSVYISDTGPHAETQLETIRREIETNHKFIAIYGNLVPERTDPQKWTGGEFETLNGVSLKARGSHAQIRGLNKLAERPKRIVLDDIENRENTGTPEQREKLEDWYFGDVEPALPKIKGVGHILALGTVIHPEAWIVKVSRDKRFTAIKFGCIDPEGEALWPDFMNLQQIEREKQRYAELGRLSNFYSEYMSEFRNDETARFRRDMFRVEPRAIQDTIARAIVLDPAISNAVGADYSAIAIVGITERGIIHIYDIWMKRGATPREQIDTYFRMKVQWECTRAGVESVAYQAALSHIMQEEMWRKSKELGPGAYFEIEKLFPGKTKKEERVEGIISPRYSAGYITHQRYFPEYEGQLLDWPNGKKDGPDVVAMAVSMLDPYAAFAIDDPDAILKDVYEPISSIGGAP